MPQMKRGTRSLKKKKIKGDKFNIIITFTEFFSVVSPIERQTYKKSQTNQQITHFRECLMHFYQQINSCHNCNENLPDLYASKDTHILKEDDT